MILQSLCEYYDRKEGELPPFGFEEKPIPFTIVIDSNGKFIQLEANIQETEGKIETRFFRVPKARGRSGQKSYEIAYCLWDHYGYVLAQPKLARPDAKPTVKDTETAEKQHDSFKKFVYKLKSELRDEGVDAIWSFLNSPQEVAAVKEHELWPECLKVKGCNLTFRLAGTSELTCQSPQVISWVQKQPLSEEDVLDGFCLITGEAGKVVRLHDQVSGVNQKPAPLAAINDSAYNSYGKDKGFNFPVCAMPAFKYVTALNHMLRRSSPSKFRMLETSYVCWSERSSDLEHILPAFFSDSGDDPDTGIAAVKQLFSSIHNGAYTKSDGKTRFYLLGLAPSSARIMVRFWQVGTIAEFSENLAKWFCDLEMTGRDKFGYPTLKQLLRCTALQYKDKNVAANLPPALVKSIVSGQALPAALLQALLRRIKAETGHITYNRACLLKAFLNRALYQSTSSDQEISMSLNNGEHRIGYNLGRLFACYEKLQESAQPGINATIRDRYYSSASCNPVTVFGTLDRLSSHHLKKLDNPKLRGWYDKKIREVMSKIDEFPSHLNLENQGLFAIGYYHQKQDFYTKNENQGDQQ